MRYLHDTFILFCNRKTGIDDCYFASQISSINPHARSLSFLPTDCSEKNQTEQTKVLLLLRMKQLILILHDQHSVNESFAKWFGLLALISLTHTLSIGVIWSVLPQLRWSLTRGWQLWRVHFNYPYTVIFMWATIIFPVNQFIPVLRALFCCSDWTLQFS